MQKVAERLSLHVSEPPEGWPTDTSHRGGSGGSLFWVRALIGSVCILVAAAIAVAADVDRARQVGAAVPEIDQALSFAGFGLDQVTVKGQRFTHVGDIYDALELEKSRSFAGFDAAAARQRIEGLPWVASADIRRVYPNQLTVSVVERSAFAVWEHEGKRTLIDGSGRVLTAIDTASAGDGLPVFRGAGAARSAGAFWRDLGRHLQIKSAIADAERVAERRWRLRLANGSIIELPSSGEMAALKRLEAWPGFARVLSGDATTVDLTAKGRLAIRQNAGQMPASQPKPATIADLLEPAT